MPRPTPRARITRRGPSGSSCSCSRCSSTSPAGSNGSARSSSPRRSCWCCSSCRCWTGSCPRRLVHFLACALVFALVGGAGYLTVEALQADATDKQFHRGPQEGRRGRERALFLAASPEVGHPARRGRVPDAPRPAHARASGAREEVPGLPRPGEGKGTGEQTAPRPQGFRLARVGSRAARETPGRGLLRQGATSATGWPSGRRARS